MEEGLSEAGAMDRLFNISGKDNARWRYILTRFTSYRTVQARADRR